jgi:TolB-like protein
MLPDRPSLAVLPFDSLGGSSENSYFADGMTDDIITDLSKLSRILVIARNSSWTYKGKSVKVQQVAKELGVRYVLQGSVRREGDTVRINAQLVDAVAASTSGRSATMDRCGTFSRCRTKSSGKSSQRLR